MKVSQKPEKRVSLELDDETYEWLVARAEANERSEAGQVRQLIKYARKKLSEAGSV